MTTCTAARLRSSPCRSRASISSFWMRRTSSIASAGLMATRPAPTGRTMRGAFAALGRAGADIAAGAVSGYAPGLVHAHDWQAAMTLAYMRYGAASALPTVMTVHNLAFQGQFPASVFPLLGLPPQAMALDGVEYYGGVGFLKAGLQAASAITTVSPTYAQEIRTPEFGMGLDGLVNLRAGDLHGIVNGIDTDIWNPATDKHLAETYSARSLKGAQDQQARRRGTLQSRQRRQPDSLRRQPPDLAKGHGYPRRRRSMRWPAWARGWPFWGPAIMRWKVLCSPVPPAIAAASASSSATMKACRI